MGTFVWLICFPISYVVSVVIHELAHALAAHWVGLKVYSVSFGSGRPIKTWRYGNTDVRLCGFPASGLVMAFPLKAVGYRWKNAVMTVAGPVINLLLFAVCGLAAFGGSEEGRTESNLLMAALAMAAANAILSLQTLWPHEFRVGSKTVASDGLSLIRLPRMKDSEVTEAVTAGRVVHAMRLNERGESARALRWLLSRLPRDTSVQPEYLAFAAALLTKHERHEQA
jgi:membrane-associated protease RseP (regulator of RpoE activity)